VVGVPVHEETVFAYQEQPSYERDWHVVWLVYDPHAASVVPLDGLQGAVVQLQPRTVQVVDDV
jgi:hypothetical protein